jgi:hypothetical protein
VAIKKSGQSLVDGYSNYSWSLDMSGLTLPSGPADQCGCMAVRHKFQTSCKACAWIACEQYGHNLCLKCKEPLCPPMTAEDAIVAGYDEGTIGAYKMLDKLLQFDKENAQRTHVHDAQADYYETGTWLTEEEKADIDRREKLRQQVKTNHLRRKVNINFDIAGRRVVDFVEEDEEDVPERNMSKQAICSPFADNDGRPSWMYDDDGPGCNTSNGAYAQALKSNLDEVAATDATAPGAGGSPAVGEIAVPVYENIELERNKGKAAEIYRLMKKR